MVNRSTSIKRVRAPCDGYFSVETQKYKKQYFYHTNEEILQWVCRRTTGSQYFRWLWRGHSSRLESPDVGWQYFRESRRRWETISGTATSVGKSREKPRRLTREVLATWQRPCALRGLLKIFGHNTVLERELRQREETTGSRPISVGDIWSGTMSVRDIWVVVEVSWGRRCPDQSPGRGHDLWLRRELVRRHINVAIGW